MKGLLLILLACVVSSCLAGRAFPTASENYVTALFRKINPDIEWDKTNYVVDLSGFHAQCEYVDVGGISYESTRTRDGEVITVIQDSGPGQETHVDAINSYIKPILDEWPDRYESHISHAEKFGCSVQPGCQGRISIACLFAPSLQMPQQPPPTESLEGKTTPTPLPEPKARAYTPQQYSLAEDITETTWDRDHFLENLSGYDIECSAMLANNADYEKAETLAKERSIAIKYSYGYAENRGETEPAMREILKVVDKPPASTLVGCSLIPDCMKDSKMYVVSSCIFQV